MRRTYSGGDRWRAGLSRRSGKGRMVEPDEITHAVTDGFAEIVLDRTGLPESHFRPPGRQQAAGVATPLVLVISRLWAMSLIMTRCRSACRHTRNPAFRTFRACAASSAVLTEIERAYRRFLYVRKKFSSSLPPAALSWEGGRSMRLLGFHAGIRKRRFHSSTR
jgi:hypothetical protein